MVDDAREFLCQYSSQVRKKHKSWHDGKLRFYMSSSRFVLYDDNNKQIGSAFITNKRKLITFLDPENFESEQHHIFGSYLVILLHEVVSKQKGNVSPKLAKTKNNSLSNVMILKGEHENNVASRNIQNTRIIDKPRSISKKQISSTNLLLRPFKPPKVIDKEKLRNSQSKVNVKKEVTLDHSSESKHSYSLDTPWKEYNNENDRAPSPIPSSLDPVLYMKENNGILRTGRLKGKNYKMRNVPILF